MSKDKVEERKDTIKPTKLFSVIANIWNDGVVSGQLIEIAQWGRSKGQKVLYTGEDAGKDFLSVVRGVIPSAIPTIEGLVMQLEKDAEHEDTAECEKVGKVTLSIFSDGFVDVDMSEMVSGARGAPKAWRLHPKDFISAMGSLVGTGGLESFKQLASGSAHASNIIDVKVSSSSYMPLED